MKFIIVIIPFLFSCNINSDRPSLSSINKPIEEKHPINNKYDTNFIELEELFAIKGIEFGINEHQFNTKKNEKYSQWSKVDRQHIIVGRYNLNGFIVNGLKGKFINNKLYEVEIEGGYINFQKYLKESRDRIRKQKKGELESILGKKMTDERYDRLNNKNIYQKEDEERNERYHLYYMLLQEMESSLSKYGEPDERRYEVKYFKLIPSFSCFFGNSLCSWNIGNKTIDINLIEDKNDNIYLTMNIYLKDIYDKIKTMENNKKQQKILQEKKNNELFQ